MLSAPRRKKPGYRKGKAHRVFRNILRQDFDCDEKNTKWCTDFTYLFISDRSKWYNCTIIDLHDRSVVASITDKSITADLSKRTLEKSTWFAATHKGSIDSAQWLGELIYRQRICWILWSKSHNPEYEQGRISIR